MFDLLLEDNLNKGHHRLSLEQLIDEALIFLTAGTDSTSYSLSAATFHVLHTPVVLQRLQEELCSIPRGERGRIEWRSVQNLPYMVCHQYNFASQSTDLRIKDRYHQRDAPARKPPNKRASPRCPSFWCSCTRPIHSRRCKSFDFDSLLFPSHSVAKYVLPEGLALILSRDLDSCPNNHALDPPECQTFPVP